MSSVFPPGRIWVPQSLSDSDGNANSKPETLLVHFLDPAGLAHQCSIRGNAGTMRYPHTGVTLIIFQHGIKIDTDSRGLIR